MYVCYQTSSSGSGFCNTLVGLNIASTLVGGLNYEMIMQGKESWGGCSGINDNEYSMCFKM